MAWTQGGVFFCLLAVILCALEKPHIVTIIVDDYGWTNIGYHQQEPNPEVQTPNLDKLAKTGIELDRHYAYKICSPSRSSFFTGRLSQHVNDINKWPTVHNPKDPISGYQGIPVNMTGVATKMKQGGYRTHLVGKWDAGMATPAHTPVGRGFESWLGYYHHSNDYYTEREDKDECKTAVDLWNTDKPAYGMNGTVYEEELFTQRSLDIIANHNALEPLFLVHSFHLIHVPLQVPSNYSDRFAFIDFEERRLYAAMVAYMDEVVGKLVQALMDKGIWNNTLLVFTSDNGGPIYKPNMASGANNWPLKGGKESDWEGGIRVNAFVNGGFVPPQMRTKKITEYAHISDWYTTFCGLAGVDPFDQQAAAVNLPPVDGLDLWPLLSGKTSTGPHAELHISNLTLIQGPWKLISGVQTMSGWTGLQYPNATGNRPWWERIPFVNHWEYDCGRGCLYNIMDDPTEQNNLADQYPDILSNMVQRLQVLNEKDFHPDRGDRDPAACVWANHYGGYYGPFVFN